MVAVRSESVLGLITLLYSNSSAESDEEDEDVVAVVEAVLRLVLLVEDILEVIMGRSEDAGVAMRLVFLIK